jgi:hypothetical protein
MGNPAEETFRTGREVVSPEAPLRAREFSDFFTAPRDSIARPLTNRGVPIPSARSAVPQSSPFQSGLWPSLGQRGSTRHPNWIGSTEGRRGCCRTGLGWRMKRLAPFVPCPFPFNCRLTKNQRHPCAGRDSVQPRQGRHLWLGPSGPREKVNAPNRFVTSAHAFGLPAGPARRVPSPPHA